MGYTASVEGAVWSEAFRDCDTLSYNFETFSFNNKDYPVDSLEKHSWSHWFRQPDHSALSRVDHFVNSRNKDDSALKWMKRWNTLCSGEFSHYNRTHSLDRTPLRNSLPEFAALLKKGYRYFGAGLESDNLTDPIGAISIEDSINLDFHLNSSELGGETSNLVNLNAMDYGWGTEDDESHNSMNLPYYNIYPWYQNAFRVNSSIIPAP